MIVSYIYIHTYVYVMFDNSVEIRIASAVPCFLIELLNYESIIYLKVPQEDIGNSLLY